MSLTRSKRNFDEKFGHPLLQRIADACNWRELLKWVSKVSNFSIEAWG
jgi:hypothetical protein